MRTKKAKRAAALVTAVFATLLLLTIVGVLGSIPIIDVFHVTSYSDGLKAFYIAESGNYFQRQTVYQLASWFNEENIGEPPGYGLPWWEEDYAWGMRIRCNNIFGNGTGDVVSDSHGNISEGWPYSWWNYWGFSYPYYCTITDYQSDPSRGYFPGESDARARRSVGEYARANSSDFYQRRYWFGPFWNFIEFGNAEASTEDSLSGTWQYWGDGDWGWEYNWTFTYYATFAIDRYYQFYYWRPYYPPWYPEPTYWETEWHSMGTKFDANGVMTYAGDSAPWLEARVGWNPMCNGLYIQFAAIGMGFQSVTIKVYVGGHWEDLDGDGQAETLVGSDTLTIYSGGPPSPITQFHYYPFDPDHLNKHYFVHKVRVEFVAGTMFQPPEYGGATIVMPVGIVDMGLSSNYPYGMGMNDGSWYENY